MTNVARRVARLRNLMAKAKAAPNYTNEGWLLDQAGRLIRSLHKLTRLRDRR
jgi:hypothetical protein